MKTFSILILTVAFYSADGLFGIDLTPKAKCLNSLIEEFKNTTEAALLPLMKTVVDHPPLEKDVQEVLQVLKRDIEKLRSLLHENIFRFLASLAKTGGQIPHDSIEYLVKIAQQLKSYGDSELADQITQIGKQISASVNKLPPAIAQCLKA